MLHVVKVLAKRKRKGGRAGTYAPLPPRWKKKKKKNSDREVRNCVGFVFPSVGGSGVGYLDMYSDIRCGRGAEGITVASKAEKFLGGEKKKKRSSGISPLLLAWIGINKALFASKSLLLRTTVGTAVIKGSSSESIEGVSFEMRVQVCLFLAEGEMSGEGIWLG